MSRSLEALLRDADKLGHDLVALDGMLIVDLTEVTERLRKLKAEVEVASRWEPVPIAIPPVAGAKPCALCGVIVSQTKNRYKVPLPPGSGSDLSGHGAGIFVGPECVDRAQAQVMGNYPNAIAVDRLLASVEDGLIPTFKYFDEQAEAVTIARDLARFLREWMGWTH